MDFGSENLGLEFTRDLSCGFFPSAKAAKHMVTSFSHARDRNMSFHGYSFYFLGWPCSHRHCGVGTVWAERAAVETLMKKGFRV